jgi:metallo-beta-lactamase family protein
MATLIFNGAAEQVTGSCFLLSTDHGRVLFDCGLFQGDGEESEERNEQPFPFDAKAIDAVVLSHAHLDHSGRLPLLARRGFSGPVYATRATHDLLEVMLKDAAFLEQKDTEWENRRRERAGKEPIEPTFTIEDVETILGQRRALEYHQEQTLLPDLKVHLVNAGHILGAASIVADVGQPGNSRRLVVSGDLGNHWSPLMKDPEPIHSADLVLMESTYGDRDHKPLQDTLEEFEQILEAAADNGGNVIIPSFAVERAQDLIYWLGRFWRDGKLNRHQVFLDSPMAIQASEIYEQHHDLFNHDDPEFLKIVAQGWQAWLPTLRYTRHTEESMMLNKIASGAVIIAGSGMCTGGRVRHHLKHNLWKHKSHVVIVGYQARGTLGRRLVDGAERVRLYGQDIAVRAEVHTLGGFSAHAGQQQLLDWANQFHDANPQFYLVHGEPEALWALSERLERDGLRVAVASEGQRIDI